ncbi:MAG: 3-methyl-2-oxobutanoate dehydrogenase subunit beta, partial [Methanotrichaceae archaeon]|nr:3-methyl-2-oxobutanoate dehydrogenase subunit beta [Methanotrichaceae archaeon]
NNIVLAPNSVQEMCDFTIKAFDISFKYRNPTVVLADGVLGHMVESLKFPQDAIKPLIDTSWAVSGNADTKGNLLTSIYLNFDELEGHNLKLQEKYQKIRENEVASEEYKLADAKIVLVSYGISSRIAKSAVDMARKVGIRVGLFRPITLFPFPYEKLGILASRGCRFISVEMSNGQMRDDVRLGARCADVELVSRYGGNLIRLDQIMQKIEELI